MIYRATGRAEGDCDPIPEKQEDTIVLRDWFAGKAMQGLLARIPWSEGYSEALISEAAYLQADAMLRIRKEIAIHDSGDC